MDEALRTLGIVDLTMGERSSAAALSDTSADRIDPEHQHVADPSEEWLPPAWMPDDNVAPQSPPEGSDDGTFRSDDTRLSVTSEELSSSDDEPAPSSGPMPNNPLASRPSTDAQEDDAASDANSFVSNGTGSTNSWVDEDDEALTTADLLDPYDWETEPLPDLTESQPKEYDFLKRNGMIPIRDENDAIYRCLQCAWEVEYGYCPHCKIWFDGIAPPDCKWHSTTPCESSLELSDVAKDAKYDPESQADQVVAWENSEIRPESSESSEIGEIEVEADSTSCEPQEPGDKVGKWLRNIGPRLESLNDSAFRVFKAATCMSGPPEASLDHLSNAHSLDNEAITLLRLGRWDHEFFKQKVKIEREQVQHTVNNLEDQLRRERKEFQRVENELSNLKEELRTRTIEADEAKRLQSELAAYKMIAQAEWRSREMNSSHEKRKAPTDNEEYLELGKRRRIQPAEGEEASP
ncbi:hypothetical protein NA57DRAFT_60592 [Rhizodiscina lignyota]|uniref:Uncharacterized protein n=1 Tax=Rhizodiscina lignyota TaxID=1504668 RepID=A0A9P4I8X0_9PEZI|nr:hypothetical protein NA57DRAFT_60592 [Rhizodiscina lignyota]